MIDQTKPCAVKGKKSKKCPVVESDEEEERDDNNDCDSAPDPVSLASASASAAVYFSSYAVFFAVRSRVGTSFYCF